MEKDNIKNEVKEELKKLVDKKYKEFHSGLCPNVDTILGVRVPVLRNYAKKLLSKYDIEILQKNIDDEYYEEIMLKGMIIGLSRKLNKNEIFSYISNFIPKIDNWAVCDTFCAGLKITHKYEEEMWEFIQKYIVSSKEFENRFAIVMILDYFINDKYIKKDLELLDKIKSDKYYVQMAIAWAISICLIKYYNLTKKYLEICNLDKFTYNKSIQKAIESFRITKEQKEKLRKMKK